MTAPRPLVNVMKIRLWLRQRSISAPRMTIRRQMSAPVRMALLLLLLAAVGGVAFGGYDLGRTLSLGESAATLAPARVAQVGKPPVEADRPEASVTTAESQLNMERAAQRQLAAQLKALEAENSKLKEDLAFFESLLPADRSGGAVSIRRLKANTVGANQLRYRLLVMQGGKGEHDFNGAAQIAVTIVQNGKSAIIVFPEAGTKDPVDTEKFQLAFRRYQRIEGVLTLPDGAEMKSVQARILENGKLRAQQTALVERNS